MPTDEPCCGSHNFGECTPAIGDAPGVCCSNCPDEDPRAPTYRKANASDLRDAVAEAIVSHEWDDFPRSAHSDHSYYGECAICQGDIPRIAEVALAALGGDPGDVPKRMAEAIDETWTSEEDFDATKAVTAVMGVRDELVAHLAARAATAEARVEHAEAGAQLSSERLAKVRQELAEAERRRDNYEAAWELSKRDYQYVADQLFELCTCDCNPETTQGPEEDCPVHGADEYRPPALSKRVQQAERELTKAKAVWCEWRERLGGSFPRAMVQEMTAALNAENTTTPARETA